MVLVHGANHGGWCWRRVVAPLREAGFEIYAPSLTGLGERVHLLTEQVDLNFHIRDIVELIEAEELTDVALVGHSYGCLVVVGVAAAIPDRVREVVLVDGPIVVNGESGASSHPFGHLFVERKEVIDGVEVIPPTDGSSLGLDSGDLEWVRRRLRPQPFRSVTQPISLPDGWEGQVDKAFIRCVRSDDDAPAPYVSRATAEAGWQYREIRSGHDVMISQPAEFIRVVTELCAPSRVDVMGAQMRKKSEPGR
jgi:pimeloyl-ACP methyl ester carboxylesterase